MNILIDTHIYIWLFTDDSKINNSSRELISDRENQIYLSKISFLEIAIKINIGRLMSKSSFQELENYLYEKDILLLDFEFSDLSTYISLPFHHRNPFDRLIIAQAINNNFHVISDDGNFKKYSVKLLE